MDKPLDEMLCCNSFVGDLRGTILDILMVGGISGEQYRPDQGLTNSTTTTSVSVMIKYVCQVQPK